MEVKVRIFADSMVLTADSGTITIHPRRPYKTTRLLVGTFEPAVECLKQGLKDIGATGLVKSRPRLRIQAEEMADGGLSEIEERCLRELGHAAGASSVEVRG